jgi:hypothetical protein
LQNCWCSALELEPCFLFFSQNLKNNLINDYPFIHQLTILVKLLSFQTALILALSIYVFFTLILSFFLWHSFDWL